VTLAHIGGVPAEELLPAIAPMVAAAAYATAVVRAWLRRR
jgi:hypothetical protein